MAVVEGGDRRPEASGAGKKPASPSGPFGGGSRPLPREARPRPLELRAGTAVLSFPHRAGPSVPGRFRTMVRPLPADAFVSIGRKIERPRGELPRFAKRGPSASANDNLAMPSPAARSVWRDLFFLAVLATTVVGAFWSGKIHGLQNVIVVPDAPSFRSIIT